MPYSDHSSSVSPPRIASNATFDLNSAPNARPFPVSFPPVSKNILAHFQALFSISIPGLNLWDKFTTDTIWVYPLMVKTRATSLERMNTLENNITGELNYEERKSIRMSCFLIAMRQGVTMIDQTAYSGSESEQKKVADLFNKAAQMSEIGLVRVRAMILVYARHADTMPFGAMVYVKINEKPQGTISLEDRMAWQEVTDPALIPGELKGIADDANYWPPPTRLYQGVDVWKQPARGAGEAVIGGEAQAHDGVDEVQYRLCVSSTDLYRMFSLDMDIKYKWNLESVGMKFALVNEVGFSENDIAIVVLATRRRTFSATSPQRKTTLHYVDAQGQVTDPPQFRNEYGTHFVSDIVWGGQFMGLYRFRSSDSKTRNDMMAKLTGEVGTGGSLSGAIEANIKRMVSKYSTSVYIRGKVCGGPSVPMPDPQNYLQYALKFNTVLIQAPTMLDYSFNMYDIAGIRGATNTKG